MPKTAALTNTAFVVNTLTKLAKTNSLDVSYHLTRTFEQAGLVIPVLVQDGPGRAKRTHEISEKGRKVVEIAKAATDQIKSLYMKDGQPVVDPVQPIIKTVTKEEAKKVRIAARQTLPARARQSQIRSSAMKELNQKMERLEMLISAMSGDTTNEPKVIRANNGRFQKRELAA